jgi:thioredoxin-related protein
MTIQSMAALRSANSLEPVLTRRRLLVAGGALCASGISQAAPATLPSVESLPDELAKALRKDSPLVVMVSLDGCPFCKVARENYLGPLHEQQGLPVVQVDMRSRRSIRNFQGDMVTQDELIRSWRIKIAPTVLFFGSGGVEIAERLVGGYIPDFYGAYLDERLAQSRATLRK